MTNYFGTVRHEGTCWWALEITTDQVGTGDTREEAIQMAVELAADDIAEGVDRLSPLTYWLRYIAYSLIGSKRAWRAEA